MSPENERANATAELARAVETLRAAEVLLQAGFASDAVGRAYYAAFHAVRALLFSVGLEPRSHRGLVQLFNVHFVRTGKIDARHLAALAEAQYDRTAADYGAAPGFDADQARREIVGASALIDAVRALLASRPG